MAKTTVDYDVAIVGGGIAGIYCGWRLLSNLQDSPKLRDWAGASGRLKVAVFELSDRVGGRLLSARSPKFPNTVCELGGMRYTDEHRLVASLVENELKLPHYTQVVNDPGNLLYVRRKRMRLEEARDAHNLPYVLDWDEAQQLFPGKGADPSDLMEWAIHKLLPGLLKINSTEKRKEYLQDSRIDGSFVYEYGFWNLLARAGLSHEGHDLARTMIGYDALGANANALDLILEAFAFSPTQKFYVLTGGFERVPWILRRRFEAMGGHVILNTPLESFDEQILDGGQRGVRLELRPTENGKRALSRTARAIILAMPRRSLELLRHKGPVLESSDVRELLQSVEPVPLYKLFLDYSSPWWQNVGVFRGRSLTDMPLRQCYYWPTSTTAGSTPSSRGLIMAYNDYLNVDFWAGLKGRSGRAGQSADTRTSLSATAAEADSFDADLERHWKEHRAPPRLQEEMHRQLMELHGTDDAPKPDEAAFFDWSEEPFGGGVHLWRRGFKSWEVVDKMTHPVADFPCYICGEAYSTVQTWVEGALQTAEKVLQEHFGMCQPPWFTPYRAAPGYQTSTMPEPRPRLRGLGYSVPAQIRTNDDPIFDYLKKHSGEGRPFEGYDKRHVLAPGEDLMTVMVPAAQRALSDAGLVAADVDLLIGSGSISPYATPNELGLLHKVLGLGEHCPVVPLNREFSTFNSSVVMADALIRAGRARNVLVVVGSNWTRHVSYETPQALSAGDGAGAAVIGLSSDGSLWCLVDELSITQSKSYGEMFMQGDPVTSTYPQIGSLFTEQYFHISAEGFDTYRHFGQETAPLAVTQLLTRHGLRGHDVAMTGHQSSSKLLIAWKKCIEPAELINTIEQFANMTGATIPVNLAWAASNQPVKSDYLVCLGLGPEVHADALLFKRESSK
jgi:3-oxoacyl-[acyl-carrier-protein] synthase III/monoamine oxidase